MFTPLGHFACPFSLFRGKTLREMRLTTDRLDRLQRSLDLALNQEWPKLSATTKHLDQQADYLLPVKANQPKLFNQLSRLAHTGAVFPSGPHLEPGPRPA